MIYHSYQTHNDLLQPWRAAARLVAPSVLDSEHPWTRAPWLRQWAAACEVLGLSELTHHRPDFGIRMVRIPATRDGHAVEREVEVEEQVVLRTPFATLLRFAKPGVQAQPRLLIAAPMSGHFATLLRETVRVALADHEVYITDWHNARDVSLRDGRFGMDEYIEHLMVFLRAMGPGSHLMAICQPCVAALAATALMAEDEDEAAPISLTLMAGPVDCRVSPTEVNQLATSKPMSWFEKNLIATVPPRHVGGGRRVYPGFVQLTAFMNMNLQRHIDSFRQMARLRVDGEHEAAGATRRFYEEYFAVADLPADFYLETVRKVFQDYDLARNALTWRDRPVRPEAIRRTVLFTVEGERDDICSIGQTVAAHELCSRLKPMLKNHYVQAGAGHYGVFSGRRWQHQIYPMVRDRVHQAQTTFGRA
ncbi:poly(3-hydroxybutyrate) depolymerase [Sphaerotilus hippei]|uniref:Poly(3-hydroxybutyrate) depolymerase n=1 Tax=Sphaerotilus hippei TaxID=744406 RepID=A0A318HA95_9BURK|nr:polyhydroxyalkanoate depolymerase [Sphaerotilus hippei]PXW95495.1 poly(3-hydroxybutyrate) depolymerase [Sphaerotilus hippei]